MEYGCKRKSFSFSATAIFPVSMRLLLIQIMLGQLVLHTAVSIPLPQVSIDNNAITKSTSSASSFGTGGVVRASLTGDLAGARGSGTVTKRGASRPDLWQPDKGTREEYLSTNGLYGEWGAVRQLMQAYNIDTSRPAALSNPMAADLTSGAPMDCTGIIYTVAQLQEAIEANHLSPKPAGCSNPSPDGATSEKRKRRRKRSIENFNTYPSLKWGNPIFFKFDGQHNDREMNVIRGATRHWEMNTCLRFFEVPKHAYIGESHLLFTGTPDGCYSFVGRVTNYAQRVNLASRCLDQFGTAVHEIGHALGLWHEQQRYDRDQYVTIVEANIAGVESQFLKHMTKELGLPYDHGSVMQYSSTAGSLTRQTTILPKDQLYRYSMGQRTGLSYLDTKIINLEYCLDRCKYVPLPYACLHGGYQDPSACTRCICPDGYGGDYCQHIAYPVKAACGGTLAVNSTVQYIQSPGYDTPGYYQDFTQCTWLLQAQRGHKVNVWFEGEFGLFFYAYESCFHWIEIKYKNDFQFAGPRFCGYETPDANLESEGNQMLILLRANYSVQTTARRGFRVAAVAVPDPNYRPGDTTHTSFVPSNEHYGTSWSEWSACLNHYCQCGGCSQRQRYRICGTTRCTAAPLAATETQHCDRPCLVNDTWFYIITNYILPRSCPACCDGFVLNGDKCVPVNA